MENGAPREPLVEQTGGSCRVEKVVNATVQVPGGEGQGLAEVLRFQLGVVHEDLSAVVVGCQELQNAPHADPETSDTGLTT